MIFSYLSRQSLRNELLIATIFRKNSLQYYTYQAKNDFCEDMRYRDIDPASAGELELQRMKLFDIEKLRAQNRKIHVFLGKAKVSSKQSEHKYFIRTIARHTDLRNKVGINKF